MRSSFARTGDVCELRRLRPLLGTFVEIRVRARDRARAADAIERAFAAIARVQALMSRFDPASDVSRLNRAPVGTHIRVAPATWRVLRAAAKFSADSGGVFDVTLPVLKANWRALDLLAGGGVRRLDDVCVDLGGIAKGFAVDAAIAALRRSGIVDGGVNAGGDLRRIGASPELVHVRHPGALDRWVAVGELATGAIATSANYLDPVNAGRLHRSDGRAVWIGAGSVSVQARSCMTADALTKIVAAIGPHDSVPVLRRHRATAFVLAPSGAAWVAGADGVTSVSAERFQEVDHAA